MSNRNMKQDTDIEPALLERAIYVYFISDYNQSPKKCTLTFRNDSNPHVKYPKNPKIHYTIDYDIQTKL